MVHSTCDGHLLNETLFIRRDYPEIVEKEGLTEEQKPEAEKIVHKTFRKAAEADLRSLRACKLGWCVAAFAGASLAVTFFSTLFDVSSVNSLIAPLPWIKPQDKELMFVLALWASGGADRARSIFIDRKKELKEKAEAFRKAPSHYGLSEKVFNDTSLIARASIIRCIKKNAGGAASLKM